LTRPYQDFQLIETLRWEKGEYWLLSQHLERLVATAQHFLYPFDEKAVHHALENAAEGFGEECYRVRLTLSHDGEAAVTSSAITAPGPDTLGRFVLSEKASNSNDPFFYHKTTRRALYDGEHARLSAKTGCDEVFFINERGELTEGSRSNIFIERGGELLTPPIAAGILAGTFRRHLIEDSKRPTREKTLWPEDLKTADAVYMGNSVRGLVRVVPVA
jgi:para-aminobenzoate synthetase/4-amino-4-deoxychorismate lyase